LSVPLNIGLVGCGRAAELIYLPLLKKFDDAKVSAVLDPSEHRRNLIQKSFTECSGYSTLNENFMERIDAAIICSPPGSHVSAASELLANNKYVLVEKPLALSLDGIQQLINIESNSKASLMMGFNHRNWQPVIRLREMLANGLKVVSGNIIFCGNYADWNPVSFRTDALNDLGPHVFDLIRFLFDKPIVSVSADVMDKYSFEVKIKLPEDILIYCVISHSRKNEKSINVVTSGGSFFVKLGSTRVKPQPSLKRALMDLVDTLGNKILRKTSPIKKSFEIQLHNFFSSVKENKQPKPGIQDGIAAVRAVEAAIKSINGNGKEISLNEE
jgi:predicted dehydrogenase